MRVGVGSTLEARVLRVLSRDNPRLRLCRRLAGDSTAYREEGVAWIEGDHLVQACAQSGRAMRLALLAESAFEARADLRAWAGLAAEVLVTPDALFAQVSGLPSPSGLGVLVEVAPHGEIDLDADTVLLDRVQDAGNVGSILRSACALGVPQVLALAGTAGLWSPKVMRSAMGAHFSLRLSEGLRIQDLPPRTAPWVATDPRADVALHQCRLPTPCVWVFGHEGQGLSQEILSRCEQRVRIEQPGGQESLNVAAAAAICLYEASRQRRAKSA